jgi:hypothetical protein
MDVAKAARTAALAVSEGSFQCSCSALYFSLLAEGQSDKAADRIVLRYAKLFMPKGPIDPCSIWGSFWDTSRVRRKQCRITALLLFAAMMEKEI